MMRHLLRWLYFFFLIKLVSDTGNIHRKCWAPEQTLVFSVARQFSVFQMWTMVWKVDGELSLIHTDTNTLQIQISLQHALKAFVAKDIAKRRYALTCLYIEIYMGVFLLFRWLVTWWDMLGEQAKFLHCLPEERDTEGTDEVVKALYSFVSRSWEKNACPERHHATMYEPSLVHHVFFVCVFWQGTEHHLLFAATSAVWLRCMRAISTITERVYSKERGKGCV